MQPLVLSFSCVRIHYFMNSYYTVNIYEDSIHINKFKSQTPKYICHLNFENSIHWYVEQNQIHAFGIKVKKIVKFFKANPKDLELMKKCIASKINFDNIVAFYKCIKQVGEGADSKVFKVEDIISRSHWALKCFERKDDYLQEIRMHTNLDHPNIAAFREFFQGDQYHYIVMELLNGLTLAKMLERNQITTHQQCKYIIQALLNTLVYLQKEGIIHRDIKPANIIFQQSGKIESLKLVDFNFAMKQYDIHAQPILQGMYTAPEALMVPPQYSFKMDVFSCGAILYKLYSGEDIYQIRFSSNRINVIRPQEIDFSALERSNTPTKAVKLIKAMLNFNPEKRVTADQALEFEYFSNESLSPTEKRSRFQQRYNNDSLRIGATVDFDLMQDVDAKSGNIRNIEIHHHH